MLFNSLQRQGRRIILNVPRIHGKDPAISGNWTSMTFTNYTPCKMLSMKVATNILQEQKQQQKQEQDSSSQRTRELLPVPDNLAGMAGNASFSPHRHRDIMANVISTVDLSSSVSSGPPGHQQHQVMPPCPAPQNTGETNFSSTEAGQDAQVESYDCSGPVSLNGVMQSNVPTPFDLRTSTSNGGKLEEGDQLNHYTHLNMPGGQWSQESKFTAQDLQESHYVMCDRHQDSVQSPPPPSSSSSSSSSSSGKKGIVPGSRRDYSTTSGKTTSTTTSTSSTTSANRSASQEVSGAEDAVPVSLSKRDKLKQAFKEYGAVIVVFHVSISLMSLGCCYALISSGFDLAGVLQRLNWISESSTVFLGGTSNFLLAYGIHKLFATVRISITLAAAPFIVRFLRSKGWLKKKATSTPTSRDSK